MYMCVCMYKITVWAWSMSVMGLIRTASICHSNLSWAATGRERERTYLSKFLSSSFSYMRIYVSLSLCVCVC